jgi:predicted AAA+ superfamily ATPase
MVKICKDLQRRLLSSVIAAMGRSPAVILLGPSQVGKTTLAVEVT